LFMEQHYKDGQLHGPSLQFHRSGEVYVRQNYKEGKLDGFKRRYENGKVVSETFYKDGKPEGVTFSRYRRYDAKGFKDVKLDGQYLNGKEEGIWTWEAGGERVQVKTYKDGLLHGLWERKSEDGKQVLFRLTYNKGNVVNEGKTIKAMPFLQKATAQGIGGDPLAKRMAEVLHVDMDLDYFGTPAAEVVADLGDRFNMPMFVDIQATDIEGIGERKITVNDKQTPVFQGLHDIGAGHGLTFDYRFHALWLTTTKSVAAWKDPTGVDGLKPAAKTPLAKALPDPPKFDLLKTPIAKLAEPLQKEYGLTLDASRASDAKWTGWRQPSLSFRDSLSILLYQNHCRCREEDGS
jgi:antitoxin component YwqK of YwqJK toxin-antitoxin module